MLNLALSWDILIVVFFAVVMSAGFLLGQHRVVRIIMGCYVAMIAVQGLRSVLARIAGDVSVSLSSVGLPTDASVMGLGKIFLFALALLILLMKSGIDVTLERRQGRIGAIIATALLGFSAAGLIASTILTYVAGSSILAQSGIPLDAVAPNFLHSTLLELLVRNQDIWFALPALLLIMTSLTDEA